MELKDYLGTGMWYIQLVKPSPGMPTSHIRVGIDLFAYTFSFLHFMIFLNNDYRVNQCGKDKGLGKIG